MIFRSKNENDFPVETKNRSLNPKNWNWQAIGISLAITLFGACVAFFAGAVVWLIVKGSIMATDTFGMVVPIGWIVLFVVWFVIYIRIKKWW